MALRPAPLSGVPSPCVDVCRMHAATGWCEGCLRTIDEIAAWSTLDDAAQRAVVDDLARRRQIFRLLPQPHRPEGAA